MRDSEAASGIKPGRRMITQEVALYAAGYEEDASYQAEKTIVSANSTINDTMAMQEKEWRKQGLSYEEIFKRQEEMARKKLSDHRAALVAAMDGATNFAELLSRPQYAVRRGADEPDEPEENQKRPPQFAIPALPKHVGTPKMNGKAGFGCSTPIGSKDVSMRALRAIDLSHVVHVEQLDANRTTTHTANIVIDMAGPSSADSSLQKTLTIQGNPEDSLQKALTIQGNPEDSLQKTHTIQKDSEESTALRGTFVVSPASDSSIQKTHTIQKESESSTAIQGTYVVEKSQNSEDSTALQGTFVLEKEKEACAPEDVTITNETTIGGRRGKKVNLKEREGRMADLTTSMMGSMAETPSPGAHHFKNPRKKLRETVTARMSIESDKERSIEMLSINEDSTRGRESVGSSYVEPVTVNASQMETVVEEREEHEEEHKEQDQEHKEQEQEHEKRDVPMDITVTPKSSRNTPRPSSLLSGEAARGARSSIFLGAIPPSDHTLLTPTHHFQKPTVSSLSKNRNANAREALEALNQKKLAKKTTPVEEPAPESPKTVDQPSRLHNNSFGDVTNGLRQISMHDVPPVEDVDLGDHRQMERGDFEAEDSDHGEGTSGPPPQLQMTSPGLLIQRKSSRGKKVGLLSDSMTSVNTPGVDRRRGRRAGNETTVVDEWNSDEEPEDVPRRRNKKQVGLQLAKRRLIEPEVPHDGLRRSTRTRTKPVRNWLGEQPIYEHSPSGGRRLKGITTVFVTDKRMCKYRTADVKLATEREHEAMRKRAKRRAEERRRQLELDQSRGHRMDESQDDIHTSDEE